MQTKANNSVLAFIDLRSPYSYLALGPALEFEAQSGVTIEWWPFLTDFRSAYGGEVEERTVRDVLKLKYLYMDCRRLAASQGLTIKSTTKLWDAELVSKAMLFAKANDRLWEFLNPTLSSFWRREFDMESNDAVEEKLVGAGMTTAGWREYRDNEADRQLNVTLEWAEELGVFGAPTFVYRGEIFWGGDRLAMLSERVLNRQK
tara:strand:- start:4972 stop:5580 length:609 start_codon:yes stop_codon:yes gene_type:complete